MGEERSSEKKKGTPKLKILSKYLPIDLSFTIVIRPLIQSIHFFTHIYTSEYIIYPIILLSTHSTNQFIFK